MKVKFFRDNFNARFTWSWENGEFVTSDTALIEHYRGLGIRNEVVDGNYIKAVKETEPSQETPNHKIDTSQVIKKQRKPSKKKVD